MATQNYTEASKSADYMTVISPDGKEYEGLYCDPKLDRTTLPPGVYAYDIRHDDDGCGIFAELCHDYVLVNNAGTFFTKTAIPELMTKGSAVPFAIYSEDWNMAHENPAPPCPVVQDGWDYTF